MADAESLARVVAGQCIARRVRRLARLVTRVYDDAMRPHGLTVAQFGILSALLRNGPVSPATLGRLLDLEKSTVSRNVARMAEHGWLAVEGDGRGLELRVLAAGRRVFERAHPAWQAAQAEASSLMTAQALAI